MEIDLVQPALDFEHSARGGHAAHAPTVLACLPASLVERGRAALLDMAVLLVAFCGFLGMFAALGGRWTLSKPDLVVTAGAFALFYAQYFALFILFGGATPGMRLRGLRVITFDGADPTPRHLSWRCVGYLLSGATLLLGFFWALWDDDRLSWHDRISQTCLTVAGEVAAADADDALVQEAGPAGG
jgi:uncharacterized RDD family membrane protein YckC